MKTVMLAAVLPFIAGGSFLPAAEPPIALMVSDHTYAYFQNAYEPGCQEGDWTLGRFEYERYYLGWARVMDMAGRNYTIIRDQDISLKRLQDFRVLILANNFWLDDSQTKVITEWVRRGGRLLATFGTGYCGVNGDYFKGGTNGLHQLWGDPSAKVNSSAYLGNPWVKVRISNASGPTEGFAPGDVLDYQYMANIFVERPESSRDINGFFLFDGAKTRKPAIFKNRHSKGLVVYYAFAPEYLISIAYDVAGHCANDRRYSQPETMALYAELAEGLYPLMNSALEYLLNN